MNPTDNLPDTTAWQPHNVNNHEVQRTLLQTCRGVEARIVSEAQFEKTFNIENFDSGPGVENLVRSQLSRLLPSRYTVAPAVVVDSEGSTCGQCDVAIINSFWFPMLKVGATPESRRIHVAAESVYSIIEVKQRLTFASLDAAMKKIVSYKRLKRTKTDFGQLTENQHVRSFAAQRPGECTNFRYDTILGVIGGGDSFDELCGRFFAINATLAPAERVNALAVLGHGNACYVTIEDGNLVEALHLERPNLDCRGFRIDTKTDAFYHMFTNLWYHLYLTILLPDRVKYGYGLTSSDRSGIIVHESDFKQSE